MAKQDDNKNAPQLPEQTPEQKAAAEKYEQWQAELRAGGGDTRVTPHPEDRHQPLIVTPLEQATVPVDIHKPGASVRVENADPVPAPTGTATGVAPDEASVSQNGTASLQGAMSLNEVPVVDAAAEATKTPDEVATMRDGPATNRAPNNRPVDPPVAGKKGS